MKILNRNKCDSLNESMFKIIPAITLLLILASCSNKNGEKISDKANLLEINQQDLFKQYKLSDIVEEVELVPLETNDTTLIGQYTKVIVDSLNIYLSDNVTKTLFIFGRTGKIKAKINALGRGPFEYSEIRDFCILNNGLIAILDTERKKVVYYSSEGQPVSELKLPFYADALEQQGGNILVFNGSSRDDRIILWDIEQEKRIASYISYDVKYSGRIRKPLIKYKNNVFWKGEFKNELIAPSVEGISTARKIDFGEYNPTEPVSRKIPEFGGINVHLMLPDEAIMRRYTETDDFICFLFDCEKLSDLPFYVFYAKASKRKIVLNMDYLDEDLTFYTSPPPIETADSYGKFVSVLYPFFLLDNIEKKKKSKSIKNPEKLNAYIKKLEGLKDSDNPIICFYKIKSF